MLLVTCRTDIEFRFAAKSVLVYYIFIFLVDRLLTFILYLLCFFNFVALMFFYNTAMLYNDVNYRIHKKFKTLVNP